MSFALAKPVSCFGGGCKTGSGGGELSPSDDGVSPLSSPGADADVMVKWLEGFVGSW